MIQRSIRIVPQRSLSYRTQCTGKGEEAVGHSRPSVLQCQSFSSCAPGGKSHGGPFAEAFQGHESRGEYGPQEIDEWKAALFAPSNLSTCLNTQTTGRQLLVS